MFKKSSRLSWFPQFIYHNHLEPNIWTHDGTLNPLVDIALSLATEKFIKSLQQIGIKISKDEIVDIILGGSITNYYYDCTSDIDIYLVLNLKNMHKLAPDINWKKILVGQKDTWINNFNFRISGRRIDFTLIDDTVAKCTDCKAGALYSLLNNTWIRCPVKLTRQEIRKTKKEAYKKFSSWRKQFNKIARGVTPIEEIKQLRNHILQEKDNSLAASITQPITPSGMAFRMFRQCGYWVRLEKRTAMQNANSQIQQKAK